ncbi:hypothetical protein Q1695_008376 [Nippostrongylus brasiliensis]|nr:hypothetical protein Q1695_008376 [Nippostrongylus brasiliensis]
MANAEQKTDHVNESITANGDSSPTSTTSSSRRRAAATSDDIVNDLINDVRQSEKPFSHESGVHFSPWWSGTTHDATCTIVIAKKEKKKSKEHKHKKSKKKKKKHHHSKRDRSISRKRSRSRSRSRKKHKKRSRTQSKSRSRSTSRSVVQSPALTEKNKHEEIPDDKPEPKETPPKSPPFPERTSFIHEVSDDDDLPIGADFRTVMKEAKMKINISNRIGSSLDLSAIPTAPPLAKRPSHAFPLSKTIKRDDDDEPPLMEKRESAVLNKVIAEKGRGDFIPRNLKVKSVCESSSHQQAKSDGGNVSDMEVKTVEPVKLEGMMDISPDEDEKGFEFGPSAPSRKQSSLDLKPMTPIPEQISDGELEKEIVEELTAAAQPKISVKVSKVAKVIESTTATLAKTASKAKESRKRRRSPKPRSASPNTDEEIKIKARTSSGRPSTTQRRPSPHRSRGRGREDRERRSRSVSRRRYSRSRSRPRDRSRRRSKSRSKSRDRSYGRYKSRSRRSRSRTLSRSRSPSRSGRNKRGRIDKAKLLAIARKKAQKMQLLGISLGSLDPQLQGQPKSVDDFVSYCQQIQRRQDKETRREKGEAVSSEGSDADGLPESTAEGTSTFKHPFGVRTAASDGIKINIVNATSIPTKTPQERVLDTSQLRLVYPVSSGVTHKEKTDTWTPVVKDELKTCSDEQKKYVAVTSLEAERYRSTSTAPSDHVLPPPPPPPVLTGLGGLLPPPPPPPKLTAFDMLLPPPPPLPQLLVLPPEEDLIIKEPENVELTKSKDVAKMLAQRASAQLRLNSDPNDFEAIRMLKEADEKMANWAAAKNLPGKFTGSTGLNVLSSEELQPQDPRYNAWVKKDMFKNTRPTVGGVGMRLMQKMGWRPGEGLGPDGMGNLEPLLLDVKNDRKGLVSQDDIPVKGIPQLTTDGSAAKHPVSIVMELCAKRKWPPPVFNHEEKGPSNMREFRCTAIVNGKEYRSTTISRSKKDAKMLACQVVLQSLGLIPRDPTLPVVI